MGDIFRNQIAKINKIGTNEVFKGKQKPKKVYHYCL